MTSPASTFGPLSTVRYSVDGVSFDMVRVPPGRLLDGEDSFRRELLVSRPFEIGVTPVTQALWRAVMGSSPSGFRGENRPVEKISWDDAQKLMGALAARGLPGFRLPTAAEWAWAVRCGAPTRWAGADRVKTVAVIGASQTAVAADLSGSALGAFDLSGNVWEWLGDWYTDSTPGGVDVQGLVSTSRRVRRGGSWYGGPKLARVAHYDSQPPASCYDNFGVRLLRIYT